MRLIDERVEQLGGAEVLIASDFANGRLPAVVAPILHGGVADVAACGQVDLVDDVAEDGRLLAFFGTEIGQEQVALLVNADGLAGWIGLELVANGREIDQWAAFFIEANGQVDAQRVDHVDADAGLLHAVAELQAVGQVIVKNGAVGYAGVAGLEQLCDVQGKQAGFAFFKGEGMLLATAVAICLLAGEAAIVAGWV